MVRAPRIKIEDLYGGGYKGMRQPEMLTLEEQSAPVNRQLREERDIDKVKRRWMVQRMTKKFAKERGKKSFANKRNLLSRKIFRRMFHRKIFISCRAAPQEMRCKKRMTFLFGGMRQKRSGRRLVQSTMQASVVLKLRAYLAKQQGTCNSLQKPEPARRALEVWKNAVWQWVDAPPDALAKEGIYDFEGSGDVLFGVNH